MGIVNREGGGDDGKRVTGAGTGINGCDMSPSLRCVITASSDGFVKVYNAPCIVKDAPHRAYIGHGGLGGGVSKVRIVGSAFKHRQQGDGDANESEEAYVVSIGGSDGSVLQWRLTNADDQESVLEELEVA
jgi:hypothetical protein